MPHLTSFDPRSSPAGVSSWKSSSPGLSTGRLWPRLPKKQVLAQCTKVRGSVASTVKCKAGSLSGPESPTECAVSVRAVLEAEVWMPNLTEGE